MIDQLINDLHWTIESVKVGEKVELYFSAFDYSGIRKITVKLTDEMIDKLIDSLPSRPVIE